MEAQARIDLLKAALDGSSRLHVQKDREIDALSARVAVLEAALEFEHEEVKRLRARVAQGTKDGTANGERE